MIITKIICDLCQGEDEKAQAFDIAVDLIRDPNDPKNYSFAVKYGTVHICQQCLYDFVGKTWRKIHCPNYDKVMKVNQRAIPFSETKLGESVLPKQPL